MRNTSVAMTPAELTVSYPKKYPTPPIRIADHCTIVDVEKFVARAVADLEDYVAAIKAGRQNWLADCYLVDELIEKLRRCGVKATIVGADNTEPALPPLKLESGLAYDGNGLADSERPEKPKYGLTDSEVRSLFTQLGLDIADRRGLPQNILSWLRYMDSIQARTKTMKRSR